jgi:hypothetical protein
MRRFTRFWQGFRASNAMAIAGDPAAFIAAADASHGVPHMKDITMKNASALWTIAGLAAVLAHVATFAMVIA